MHSETLKLTQYVNSNPNVLRKNLLGKNLLALVLSKTVFIKVSSTSKEN